MHGDIKGGVLGDFGLALASGALVYHRIGQTFPSASSHADKTLTAPITLHSL
jgi:hypothetical protein